MNLFRTWSILLFTWIPALLPTYVWRFSLGPVPTTVLECLFLLTIVHITAIQGLEPWKQGWKRTSAWHPAIFLWLAATLVAVWIAPAHLAALGLWRAYILEPILFFVLAHGILDDKGKLTIARSLAIGGIGVALWSAVQYIFGIGIPHPWNTSFFTRRATGPFPFPNAVALFSAPIAALCLGALIQKSILLSKKVAWLGFISCTLAVILAHSVGGIIAISAALLFGLVFNKKTRIYGAIILITLPIAYGFAPTNIRAPIIKTLTFQDWSGYVRIRMWKDTFVMLQNHPIFGAGFGAYPTLFKKYQTTTGIEIFQYPHNIILNLWSEAGLFGLLAFLSIVGTWIRAGWKHALSLLPLIAILVHGLVDVPYFKNDLAFAFWIFAYIVSTYKKAP